MLKKYSILSFLVAGAFALCGVGCVSETASTAEEATQGMSGSLRAGENETVGGDMNGSGKAGVQAPLTVQFTSPRSPGFDPTIHVAGDPQPQPWTEPKRGPVSDGR